MARNFYNSGSASDDYTNAMRSYIAEVMAAQAAGIPLEQYQQAIGSMPMDPAAGAGQTGATVGFSGGNLAGDQSAGAPTGPGFGGSAFGGFNVGAPAAPSGPPAGWSNMSDQVDNPDSGYNQGLLSPGFNDPGATVSDPGGFGGLGGFGGTGSGPSGDGTSGAVGSGVGIGVGGSSTGISGGPGGTGEGGANTGEGGGGGAGGGGSK
jgi:hypothetical protein